MVFSILLVFIYTFLTFLVIKKVFHGDPFYLLIYILFFLPFYSFFQLLVFKTSDSIVLLNFIRYSKDIVIFSSFVVFIFGSKSSFFLNQYKLSSLDKWIIYFTLIVSIYALLPIGEVGLWIKLIYAKNLFFIPIIYFLGRNTDFDSNRFRFIKKTLSILFIIAFVVASIEYFFGIHLQSILGYSNYNLIVNDTLPTGNFDLSWTFERSADHKRFASFFSNPLEYSASLLLFMTIPVFHLLHNQRNKLMNFIWILLIIISFYFAYSRASIISAFLIVVSALLITKNFKILFYCFVLFLIGLFVLYYNTSEDTLYFILDTFTFKESSTVGHLLEWIQALIAIVENPFGLGLALSGNASVVDQSIKVGGENQFLIYGVQMGVLSIIIYSIILYKSITISLRVYFKSNGFKRELGFISGLVKLGLLIPLFTANAELYLFISIFSWFLIGQSQKIISELKYQ